MKPMNKHTVLKQVRTNNTWYGGIAPNKAMFGGPWNIGMDIFITYGRDGKYYAISYNTWDYVELDMYLRDFAYYNCCSELGNKIRFWEIN